MPESGVILLVEDRGNDLFLIRKALEKAHVYNPVQVVRSGEEAISYLKGEGKFGSRDEFPLPSLVLLDLKMPGLDGFAVLSWIRQQPGLCSLRVIIFSGSDEPTDVNTAYRLGANSFLVKPMDFEQFIDTTKLIKDYWLRADRPPDAFRAPKEFGHGSAHN